jgi:hypothetical protein
MSARAVTRPGPRAARHTETAPPLSLRALSDGRILINCFAGCPPAEVVQAVGMELADLMPPRPRDTPDAPGGYPPLPVAWRQQQNLLAETAHEALVVVIGLEREWSGADLSLEDQDRLLEAAQRLRKFAYDAR